MFNPYGQSINVSSTYISPTRFTQFVLQHADRTDVNKLVKYLYSTFSASIHSPLYNNDKVFEYITYMLEGFPLSIYGT